MFSKTSATLGAALSCAWLGLVLAVVAAMRPHDVALSVGLALIVIGAIVALATVTRSPRFGTILGAAIAIAPLALLLRFVWVAMHDTS